MLKNKIKYIISSQAIINILLKVLSIGPKFLLSFFIAQNASLSQLGQYTLFSTTVLIVSSLIGLEYHNYSNRELINANNYDKHKIFSKQINLYLSLYFIILIPVSLLLLQINIISLDVYFLFLSITIFEHFSTELFRLLVISGRPIKASIIMFFRTGFWAVLAILIYYFKVYSSNITWVYWIWLFGELVSVIVGLYYLDYNYSLTSFRQTQIKPLLLELRHCFGFLTIALTAKVMDGFGRYYMNYFGDKEMMGVFSFYYQIANMINVLIFSGLFVFFMPIALKSYKGYIRSIEGIENYRKKSIAFSMVISLGILIVAPFLIDYMDNKLLSNYLRILFLLVISQIFLNLFYTPYLQLYASRNEKKIVYIYLISTIVQILCAVLLQIVTEPIYALCYAIVISNLLLWMLGMSMVSALKKKGR